MMTKLRLFIIIKYSVATPLAPRNRVVVRTLYSLYSFFSHYGLSFFLLQTTNKVGWTKRKTISPFLIMSFDARLYTQDISRTIPKFVNAFHQLELLQIFWRILCMIHRCKLLASRCSILLFQFQTEQICNREDFHIFRKSSDFSILKQSMALPQIKLFFFFIFPLSFAGSWTIVPRTTIRTALLPNSIHTTFYPSLPPSSNLIFSLSLSPSHTLMQRHTLLPYTLGVARRTRRLAAR